MSEYAAIIVFVAPIAICLLYLWCREEEKSKHMTVLGEKNSGRRQLRYVHGQSLRIFVKTSMDEQMFDGHVIDSSENGLGIVIGIPPIGKLHIWYIKSTKDLDVDWVPIEIRNVVKEPQCWRIGCQFLESVTEYERKAFMAPYKRL